MKSLISTICILGLVGMVVGVAAQGATEGNVTATVTVQNISVAVTDGTVTYGTLTAGASQKTNALSPVDTQTATNNGNVTETLNIRGTNSAAWTLAAAASGATNYKHEFSKDGFVTAGTALTLVNQTLASGVAAGGNQTFDLQITTPPSAADFSPQSVNVIVQATI